MPMLPLTAAPKRSLLYVFNLLEWMCRHRFITATTIIIYYHQPINYFNSLLIGLTTQQLFFHQGVVRNQKATLPSSILEHGDGVVLYTSWLLIYIYIIYIYNIYIYFSINLLMMTALLLCSMMHALNVYSSK